MADARPRSTDHLRENFLTKVSNNRLRRIVLAKIRKEK